MKKVVIINGTMGVGKTAVSKALFKQVKNSVWLDGDWCWMMNPFIVNDATKQMVMDNITYQLNNFLKQPDFDTIIFNWVIDEESIYDAILSRIIEDCKVYKITLMASEETITKRIQKDIEAGVRKHEVLAHSIEKINKYLTLDSIKINSDNKGIDMIVKEIITIIG